jgi:putative ABC transport system permease protein
MRMRNILNIVRRDAVTLLTNMTGLSLGLAASILLAVFIQFELSFDRHFSKADRIFRLNSIWIEHGVPGEMPINLRQAYLDIPGSVAGIESAVQLYRGFQREVRAGENRHKELNLIYSDPGFFGLFDLRFIEGNAEIALKDPSSVVLTENTANRIYGSTRVVGESFVMEDRIYTISAVIANIPPNTHFAFDMLMPMGAEPELDQLGGLEFFSYFLIEEGIDPGPVLETIRKENTQLLTMRFSSFEGSTFDSRLEALLDLHLHGHVNWDLTQPGSMKTIYIMLIITLVVMGLALTNFINLYILNGARRSREIGIRKVNGAGRREMIRQFYLETLVVVSISFLAGAILAIMLLPAFAQIMQRESFTAVTGTAGLYLVLGGIYLLTIALSGFYPAMLLSRAAPVPLIRGMVNPAGDKRTLLRVASIFQVSIAVCLLSILAGINSQIRYLKNHSPGYHPEHVVQISNLNQELTNNYPAIRDRLLGHSSIEEVAASHHLVGRGTSGQGIRMHHEEPDQERGIREYRIQPGLCGLYRFELVAGRFLDRSREPDRMGIILNEAAVDMLGYTPGEIIGEQVVMHSDPLEVKGVVKNFHYESAARSIEPLVLTAYSDRFRNLSVRYTPGSDPQQVLRTIDETIREFDPAYEILYSFPTDIIRSYYTREDRLQKIVLAGSLLSVLIVLLGIYALVSHNIVSRTKEIGIRKVMGGTTTRMIRLLYSSTLKWNLIGAGLAIPFGWLYLNNWLNDYILRIPLRWWLFILPVLLVIAMQTLITMARTWQAAGRNPVESLRYE